MTDFPFTEETLSKLRTAVGEGLSPYRYRHILEVEILWCQRKQFS